MMAKRNEWIITCSASELAQAATDKSVHHLDRLQFWAGKKNAVIEQIKNEGIEVDESLSNFTSNSYRPGGVNIRNDLVVDLHECTTKISEHREKLKEYSGWKTVLQSQGQTPFPLHHDDWLYFFGKYEDAAT